MSIRMRLIACIAIALPALGRAQALDPSTYSLTAAAAEPLPYVASRWTGVCEDAQRHLLEQ